MMDGNVGSGESSGPKPSSALKKRKGGIDLDQIMDSMNTDERQTSIGRKTKEAIASTASTEGTISSIVASLSDLSQILANKPHMSDVEVELRLGILINGTNFRSGVTVEDWRAFREHLDGSPDLQCRVSKESDYLYDVDDVKHIWPVSKTDGAQTIRASFDDETMKCTKVTLKRRVKTINLPSAATNAYDTRFSVATEEKLTLVDSVPENFRSVRHKSRRSYTKVAGGAFSTDLTDVTSSLNPQYSGSASHLQATENVGQTFEVEFELDAQLLPKLSNQSTLNSVVRSLWEWISYMNKLQPIQKSDDTNYSLTFPELEAQRIRVSSEVDSLRMLITKACGADPHNHKEFPGSMPVALSRAHFSRLAGPPPDKNAENGAKAITYYVSEKTDGVRFILLVSPEKVVFCDRKFDMFDISHRFPKLKDILAEDGNTILDGELIRHHHTNKLYFMVFDVLQLNATSYINQLLSDRLLGIAQVVDMYRKALVSQDGQPPMLTEDHPFEVIGKLFVPKHSITNILKHISTAKDGERYYQDQRRYHKTDGLIFTPNEPYTARGTANLFKWKYIDRVSIDFKLVMHDGREMQLACRGANNDEIVCRPANFTAEDTQKLNGFLRDYEIRRRRSGASELQNLIVECAFLPNLGTDKNQPNHIRVVFDTMESIAQNISKEDIIRVCAGSHALNAYLEQQKASAGKPPARSSSHSSQPHPPSSHPKPPPPSHTTLGESGGAT